MARAGERQPDNEIQFSQNVSQVFFGINMKCASCHDSFIDRWKLDDAYGLAAIVADKPLEIFRCDKATGKMATPGFLLPELGSIDPASRGPSGWRSWRGSSRMPTTAGLRGRSSTGSGTGSWGVGSWSRSM